MHAHTYAKTHVLLLLKIFQINCMLLYRRSSNSNHRFTAIIQVNLRQLAPPVMNWRILLVQSFTAGACMPLLAATSTFGLARRRWSSP